LVIDNKKKGFYNATMNPFWEVGGQEQIYEGNDSE